MFCDTCRVLCDDWMTPPVHSGQSDTYTIRYPGVSYVKYS